jgi:hypothetical protein
MFFISVPKDEADSLDTCGVNVRINGQEQKLFRVGNQLTWTDNDGTHHNKRILASEEILIEVRGREGLHPCISFTCGDKTNQRLEQVGPISVLVDEDEEWDESHFGGDEHASEEELYEMAMRMADYLIEHQAEIKALAETAQEDGATSESIRRACARAYLANLCAYAFMVRSPGLAKLMEAELKEPGASEALLDGGAQ